MKLSARSIDISIIIVCLVFFELMIRAAAPLVSGNVKQIYEIPDVASDLAKEKSAILFLGNSLVGNALNLPEFDRQAGINMRSYRVVPDSSSLWDWTCIIKNSFINKNSLPKVVVIGFAWGEGDPVPSRLGGFFCNVSDLPNLISMGMRNGSDIIDFLFSKISKLYAMRETIRKRILDILIPEYRVYTRMINTERNKNRQVKHVEKQSGDYPLLSAYLKLLVSNNIQPVIVAMPVKQKYELDKYFFKAVKNNGGIVIDYRELEGIDNSMFRDPIHLNERGNKVFTHHLASDMRSILSKGDKIEEKALKHVI